jgi:hypothetical protein
MPPETGVSDREKLSDFLGILKGVLMLLLEHRDGLLPDHLWESLQGAWPQADAAISDLRQQLINPVNAVDLENRLESVGLKGASLHLKLLGFDAVVGPVRPPQGPQHRGWFERVFGWAAIILGSLSKVLPDADVIREFQEAGEQGLRDAAP